MTSLARSGQAEAENPLRDERGALPCAYAAKWALALAGGWFFHARLDGGLRLLSAPSEWDGPSADRVLEPLARLLLGSS